MIRTIVTKLTTCDAAAALSCEFDQPGSASDGFVGFERVNAVMTNDFDGGGEIWENRDDTW